MGDNLYNRTGDTYDATRRADPLIAQRLLDLLNPSPDGIYLDLGCGTGNYTIALAAHGGHWVGADISETMLDTARRKSHDIEWHLTDAAALPFQASTITGAVCILATHHFHNRAAVFRELRRVLQDEARVVLFTGDRDQMRGYWLNHYFPKAMAKAIQQMISVTELEKELTAAQIQVVQRDAFHVPDDLQDLFLYSGKHRPQLYLHPAVRAGISTFASLADSAEIKEGCRQLESDIRTGHVHDVIKSYENQLGDYTFLVGKAI